jgi:hypothetical protein
MIEAIELCTRQQRLVIAFASRIITTPRFARMEQVAREMWGKGSGMLSAIIMRRTRALANTRARARIQVTLAYSAAGTGIWPMQQQRSAKPIIEHLPFN